jgi:hypothetical protein
LEDVLIVTGIKIGTLVLKAEDCTEAVNILNKQQVVGRNKKKASDGAYNLAAQLLAAQLNLAADAVTCKEVENAVEDGQALLENLGFDGTDDYLKARDPEYADAIDLATTLDNYNNGILCPPLAE